MEHMGYVNIYIYMICLRWFDVCSCDRNIMRINSMLFHGNKSYMYQANLTLSVSSMAISGILIGGTNHAYTSIYIYVLCTYIKYHIL